MDECVDGVSIAQLRRVSSRQWCELVDGSRELQSALSKGSLDNLSLFTLVRTVWSVVEHGDGVLDWPNCALFRDAAKRILDSDRGECPAGCGDPGCRFVMAQCWMVAAGFDPSGWGADAVTVGFDPSGWGADAVTVGFDPLGDVRCWGAVVLAQISGWSVADVEWVLSCA